MGEKIEKIFGWCIILFFGYFIISPFFVKEDDNIFSKSEPYTQGDLSDVGGSPTYRYDFTPTYEDDPYTTNDESNDQELGYYGTNTVYACNGNSGNCYDLDADFNGDGVERLYFEKGGWVDIYSSDCEDGYCYLEDENGTEWEIEF